MDVMGVSLDKNDKMMKPNTGGDSNFYEKSLINIMGNMKRSVIEEEDIDDDDSDDEEDFTTN